MYYRLLWPVAMTGLALHLTGLGWDVYRHSRDAALAQREDVLSLTNPSHLMIVGGTALMAAALFGIAVAWMQERRIGGDGAGGALLRAAGLPAVGSPPWASRQLEPYGSHLRPTPIRTSITSPTAIPRQSTALPEAPTMPASRNPPTAIQRAPTRRLL